MMDLDDLRSILKNSGVDVWTLIETAISVASVDCRNEMVNRRDGIVERLYAPSVVSRCPNCDQDMIKEKESTSLEAKERGSPSTPQSTDGDEENPDRRYEHHPHHHHHHHSVDEDQTTRILNIKDQLEDPDLSEDSVIDLLQNLSDMDITFKALKETDIGRHVNRFRKHQSNDVRRLVKHLVRKWKDLVDEWVKLDTPGVVAASALIVDGDSPLQNPQKSNQNGHHHQVPDFAFSPNPHNGSSGSDKNTAEPESKGKMVSRRLPQSKPAQSVPSPASAALPNRPSEQKDSAIDPERLASARKRLHDNYQEAQNAKKQRTIQVMDIHDIPKPKNSFFGRNKGGFQTKHW